MRLILVFLMFILSISVFGQDNEVTVILVPTGQVINDYDTIYNLEIYIEPSTLQDLQSADLFINGLDSNYTVPAIDVLSPGNSSATPNGNRFRVSTENNRKKIIMLNAKADEYTVRLILTRPNGQQIIEKKNH